MSPQKPMLDELTTMCLEELLISGDYALLLPLGSVEPHGPHLPLSTDRLLSEENARRAAKELENQGVKALIAPSLAYGVTEYAQGFCGAISLSPQLYQQLLVEVSEQYLSAGFKLICLINHHLEPLQLEAIQSALKVLNQGCSTPRVIAPSVVSRRWGRALGTEFRSGACHAGSYESSMILASWPELVNHEIAEQLDSLDISLSEAIRLGKSGFKEIGMERAYTGSPAQLSAKEGERLYQEHTHMVVTEVMESLAGLGEV